MGSPQNLRPVLEGADMGQYRYWIIGTENIGISAFLAKSNFSSMGTSILAILAKSNFSSMGTSKLAIEKDVTIPCW